MRTVSRAVLLWAAVALFQPGFSTAAAAAESAACDQLGYGRQIGSATVVLAEAIPAGDHTAADGTKLKDLPSFCRVVAVASPRPGSRILIELWMPEPDRWNGKLLGTGNGGAAGTIISGALAGGLRRGFATANTDLGSYPAGLPGIGFNFGDGRPEAIRDWGTRATHEMTVLAKAVINRYYGRGASRAYFAGCSTGGHQGLTEAQRYPDDYDGIIAGAPAHNRTHLHVRVAALRQLGQQPGAAISPALMKSWTTAVTRACAGRDGGAPGDAFLTDPLRCRFAPRQLVCRGGEQASSCFSEPQAQALARIYDGTRNPRTGELIYFGDARGAEEQVQLIYGETLFTRNFDITHWILPPDRASASFDFDRDVDALNSVFAGDINAMNPDLTRFAARGGKLVMFHGWQDGIISPVDSIDYFQRLAADGYERAGFARLFMVPGLKHCGGGAGPSLFGQLAEVPMAADASPANDLLLALDHWVESGNAPDSVLGKMAVPTGTDAASSSAADAGHRPICAFPRIARYRGNGSPYLASSFVCTKAAVPRYERPAPQYLR